LLKTQAVQWNLKHESSARNTEPSRDWASTSSLRSGLPSQRDEGSCESLEQLTMHSLDNVLAESPAELQDFSAARDFSGENIAYLRAVVAWKAKWPDGEPDESQLHGLYDAALDIYTDLVSAKDAQFPINLCAAEGHHLSEMFEQAARVIYGEIITNSVLPFASGPRKSDDIELHRFSGRLGYWGKIPSGFDKNVFDSSFAEIKYLVFTNTWPKYVLERSSCRTSSSSSGSLGK